MNEHNENVSFIYLSVLGGMLAVAGWLAKWAVDNVPPPTDKLTWLVIVLAVAALACLAAAWLLALRALRERQPGILPRATSAITASVLAALLSALCYSYATGDHCIEVKAGPSEQSVARVTS